MESKNAPLPSLFQRLTEQPDQSAAFIKDLVTARPAERNDVLNTIAMLLERFVEPAQMLLVSRDDDPAQRYYDPQATAGIEVSGLVLGLLENAFPHLQAPPMDEPLRIVLEDYGIPIPLAKRREDFFRVWTALRTCLLIRKILVVFKDRSGLSRQENQAELANLRRLVSSALPATETRLLEALIRARENEPS